MNHNKGKNVPQVKRLNASLQSPSHLKIEDFKNEKTQHPKNNYLNSQNASKVLRGAGGLFPG